MAINYAAIAAAGGIGKGTPAVLTKGWKRRDNQARMDKVHDAVDLRDGLVSRISGKPLLKESVDPKLQRDHCHLLGKGAHPALKYEVGNVFNASRYEHQLFDAHAIDVEGTDANGRLIFHWNRALVKAGQEPFKLISKRRTGR